MKIFILILSLVSFLSVNAQYTLTDDDENSITDGEQIIATYDSTLFGLEAEFDCHVKSTNSNDFLFEIISTDQGGNAENWFCTNFGMCYPSTTTEVEVELLSDSIREMQLHYKPNDYVGDVTINYKVTEIGNTSNSISFSVKYISIYTGILSKESSKLNIKLFPNPAKDFVFIEKNNEMITNIELVNISGKVLFNTTVNNKFYKLNISNLQKGIYFIKVDGNINKIIKE